MNAPGSQYIGGRGNSVCGLDHDIFFFSVRGQKGRRRERTEMQKKKRDAVYLNSKREVLHTADPTGRLLSSCFFDGLGPTQSPAGLTAPTQCIRKSKIKNKKKPKNTSHCQGVYGNLLVFGRDIISTSTLQRAIVSTYHAMTTGEDLGILHGIYHSPNN
ncbi:hypothetical protein TRVA0_002S04522 [Trichomonascus vanleenenianus]|uniref:uncharacterized protein n=1 Tax=Trichomonascus vanleenenianus TaxID=2268995 RepID=UPI003ECA296B